MRYDVVIIGSGPAGLGAAFKLLSETPKREILIIDKSNYSSGGLRNDCKMNFTYPIGFPFEYWTENQANVSLEQVKEHLNPPLKRAYNLDIYKKRATRLGCRLVSISQAHLGTDGGLELIKRLNHQLLDAGVEFSFGEEVLTVDQGRKVVKSHKREIGYNHLLIAPGRQGFNFLKLLMDSLNVRYIDNSVDVGIRVETKIEHYPIVYDYYDPKFYFPNDVRTFCTNSGSAYVVQEKYYDSSKRVFYSVNGHAWSKKRTDNGMVNFAMLKSVTLTKPLASGHVYAQMLGQQAMLLGGGAPIMQRIGDFRLGKRSNESEFNEDLYNFQPTLKGCTPGDISLSMPAKIMRNIWRSLKNLDTIIPGVLHPSTIMYYPEIKLYANKPVYRDNTFQVADNIYMIGDGAGTSRGITAAWASGIRAAYGILKREFPKE